MANFIENIGIFLASIGALLLTLIMIWSSVITLIFSISVGWDLFFSIGPFDSLEKVWDFGKEIARVIKK